MTALTAGICLRVAADACAGGGGGGELDAAAEASTPRPPRLDEGRHEAELDAVRLLKRVLVLVAHLKERRHVDLGAPEGGRGVRRAPRAPRPSLCTSWKVVSIAAVFWDSLRRCAMRRRIWLRATRLSVRAPAGAAGAAAFAGTAGAAGLAGAGAAAAGAALGGAAAAGAAAAGAGAAAAGAAAAAAGLSAAWIFASGVPTTTVAPVVEATAGGASTRRAWAPSSQPHPPLRVAQ